MMGGAAQNFEENERFFRLHGLGPASRPGGDKALDLGCGSVRGWCVVVVGCIMRVYVVRRAFIFTCSNPSLPTLHNAQLGLPVDPADGAGLRRDGRGHEQGPA